jgi:hypothetical protein
MFRCDVCGRRHRWTPDLAGTTITCHCLEPVTVPPEPESDLYDMAPVPVEPIRPASPADASSVLSYQRPLEPAIDETYSEANPLIVSVSKDLVIPIALILFGTVAQFAVALHLTPSPGRAAAALGFDFVVDVGLMLAGVVFAARLLAASFGPVPTAVLKLAGIALAPTGLAMLFTWAFGGGPIPHMLGWVLSLGAGAWLFSFLFDLDLQELWVTVVIVYGIRMAAWTLLLVVIR